MNPNDKISRPSSPPILSRGNQPVSPGSFNRRTFLRASSAASVATVLAMNGLTIDIRANGASSGSTYEPDYTITFATETEINYDPGEMDLSAAQGWASENGGSGANSGSANYDPQTEKIEESGGGQPSWSAQPVSRDGKLYAPAGSTLTISKVKIAVPK
jgi:hypothetical protein